ncbi:MAG: DUF4834 family protein [Cytophagales bacterium]
MILKILLVLFLVYFLVFRFFGLLIRPFLSFLFTQQGNRYNSESFGSGGSQRTREGELKIDHVPNDKAKKGKNFDGGEYVDYEELK